MHANPFARSGAAIWRITASQRPGWARAGLTALAVLAVAVTWAVLAALWLATWVLAILGWLVLAIVYLILPWRVVRLFGIRPPRLHRRAA